MIINDTDQRSLDSNNTIKCGFFLYAKTINTHKSDLIFSYSLSYSQFYFAGTLFERNYYLF